MRWGLSKEGDRIYAEPKSTASCPLCKEEVISKCGKIKVWHWSHKSKEDCDSWAEPETKWHLDWKGNFPKAQQEFLMGRHRADIRTLDRWIIEFQNSPISPVEIIDREEYYKRMIWVLNGRTLAKGLRLREKKGTITFRWKSPPKSWWAAKKEIYIDLSEIIITLNKKLKNYLNGKSKHLTPIYEEIYYEYYTPEGKYMEVSYPKIVGHENTTDDEVKKLQEKVKLFEGKLFLVKKIYNKIPCGGWGELISKEEFIKGVKGNGD